MCLEWKIDSKQRLKINNTSPAHAIAHRKQLQKFKELNA